MSILHWPTHDRPREKLLQQGAKQLTDTELLAILINSGTRQYNAIDLARELIKQHKTLKNIFAADCKAFCQTQGLGKAKYAVIQAALEIGKRYLYATYRDERMIQKTQDAIDYFTGTLRHQEQEIFCCLFLDSQYRILRYEELFYGTINRAHVPIREVVKKALYHNAEVLILAHNHPSGIAKPSQADIHLTHQLSKALALVEIKILDHIIIGDKETSSLMEKGLI